MKSTDHGKTWTPQPEVIAEPLPFPTFFGSKFATPFFIQYGRNGVAPNVDNAQTYIYAVSNDGSWNNGNCMYLGRVLRSRISDLKGSDWTFYKGGDGILSSNWGSLEDATPIMKAQGRCSMTGICYNPVLKRYMMPQWSYDPVNLKGLVFGPTIWELYEAPTPWGPWTFVQKFDWPTQAFYNPNILNKGISADGKSMWIFTAGDFTTGEESVTTPETTLYTLHMLKMTLQTGN